MEVLEPFIVLTAIAAVPFALLGRERAAVVVLAILAVVVLARYGPGFVPVRSSGDARMTATAWNVEAGADGASRILAGLNGTATDLVALEELQPDMAAAVSTDPELAATYPYRALVPDATVLGVGLLSRYPILEESSSASTPPRATANPPFLRALVALPGPQPTAVFVIHPMSGRFQTLFDIPFALDTSERDAAIATIRAAVDVDLAANRPVLVLGDMNTTEREPAYADMSHGLHDARREAGSWPGLTWRPDPLTALPFGLLRIDYALSSPDLVPVDYSVRCTTFSDHCIVSAAFR